MPLKTVINFLKTVDELDVAKNLLNTFAKYSRSLEQFDELGMLYEMIKAYPESLKMLEICNTMAAHPEQMRSIRANLAKVYNHINEPIKSIFYSNLNLEVNPKDYEALMEQSFSFYLYGDNQTSWDIQNKLMQDPIVPNDVKNRITFNMGTFDMAKGEFKNGLKKMILGGKEIGIWKHLEKPYPKWYGQQTDKTVLVYAEAGIGDEIINIRFMKEFEKRGMNAIWVGRKNDITKLFKNNGFNVVDDERSLDPLTEYVYTESMSLPVLLDLDMDNLWHGPYLKPESSFIEKWKEILPDKFITIKWSGNIKYELDLNRSLPLIQLLETIKSSTNLPIVSIQFDDNNNTLKKLDNTTIIPDIKSWNDTLAIQFLSHLNITSCTSTAHSASSINSNCVVLPPICTYYPWVKLRDDYTSYWYSSNTKAFVQTKWRNWNGPMELLGKELKQLC